MFVAKNPKMFVRAASPESSDGGDYGVMGWEREEAAYRDHGPEFMRFATALVGTSHAEDLVSVTLTSLLQSGRWAEADDMRAYAIGALTRQAASMHRSQGRRLNRERRVASPEQTLEPIFDDPTLWMKLLSLPVRQRAVVYLTYWCDLPVGEVARTLGISDGAVRRHLARARAALRRLIL
jgi:RNA polymerase sigma factor (sigma-70 family)